MSASGNLGMKNLLQCCEAIKGDPFIDMTMRKVVGLVSRYNTPRTLNETRSHFEDRTNRHWVTDEIRDKLELVDERKRQIAKDFGVPITHLGFSEILEQNNS